VLLLLNWNLYQWRTTSRLWYLGFHREGVFIGVQGEVTELINSVTRLVLAGRPSHVAGRPPSTASTDFKLRIPCYHLLESVPVKKNHERLQSRDDRPGSLVHSHGDTYFGGNPISLVIS
jgi:hypothetical protein